MKYMLSKFLKIATFTDKVGIYLHAVYADKRDFTIYICYYLTRFLINRRQSAYAHSIYPQMEA